MLHGPAKRLCTSHKLAFRQPRHQILDQNHSFTRISACGIMVIGCQSAAACKMLCPLAAQAAGLCGVTVDLFAHRICLRERSACLSALLCYCPGIASLGSRTSDGGASNRTDPDTILLVDNG